MLCKSCKNHQITYTTYQSDNKTRNGTTLEHYAPEALPVLTSTVSLGQKSVQSPFSLTRYYEYSY